MECCIILERFLVLLVAQHCHLILLLPGDVSLPGHILCRLDHSIASIGIEVEVIHYPVFCSTRAARPCWVWVVEVGPVAGSIACHGQNTAFFIGLDLVGTVPYHSC